MSMIDTGIGADAPDPGDEAAGVEETELPRFATAIVPQATIAGRALIAVIAIMTFLACITVGAVALLRSAAGDWQADLAREVTIQVRPAPGRDIEADTARAATIAGTARGVASVRPYSKQESSALLQPWLGGLSLDELPVPRIIAVAIAAGEAPDLDKLRGVLAAQVPSASLDDHREFVDHMRAVTRMMVAGASALLVLVMIATVLSVTFATRAAMATNRQVIEVLHFIGARNNFIAGHFQTNFLWLGLKGGTIGGGLALVVFAILELADGWLSSRPAGAQLSALFGTVSIGLGGYAAMLAQIGLTAFLTAATARRTVNRTLAAVQ